MLERRFEAYKDVVVRPFFRDHFARLDRQIVLVDTLRALNAGPAAVADLETALTEILELLPPGRRQSALAALVARRIDRILFAATKADHVHSSSHDRLEALLNRLVANAARRAKFAGAETRSLALAAIRATRESTVDATTARRCPRSSARRWPARCSTARPTTARPRSRSSPATCPTIPTRCSRKAGRSRSTSSASCRPESSSATPTGDLVLPHIRFDRALDFLIGDWLK